MALRQIVQIGEPVLRKKCKVVEKIDEKIILIIWIPHPEQKPVYQISDSRSHCRVY